MSERRKYRKRVETGGIREDLQALQQDLRMTFCLILAEYQYYSDLSRVMLDRLKEETLHYYSAPYTRTVLPATNARPNTMMDFAAGGNRVAV